MFSFFAAHAEEAEASKGEINTVLFGGLDGGRSGFVNGGFKRSLGGSLDQSGPIVMAIAGAGAAPEHHDASDTPVWRPAAQGAALAGYQWVFDRFTLAGMVGPEVDYEFDPVAAAHPSRTRFGIRGHLELWSNPTPETLFAATLIAGSAREHVWSRVVAGYAFVPNVFVGPEASLYKRGDYAEWRLGAHMTGLRWRRLTLRVSAGFSSANDGRSGAYGGVSGYIRL